MVNNDNNTSSTNINDLSIQYSTCHRLIVGDCTTMPQIQNESIDLVVTSPPYFNAPHDYPGWYESYPSYLNMLSRVAREMFRVVKDGRIVALNIDDMLVDGQKYPIVADATKIFESAGFGYRDRIIWKKPDRFVIASHRSGGFIQHPYPMYLYLDNLVESIIIFQKNKFNYKSVSKDVREHSRLDKNEILDKKWHMNYWEIQNVLPNARLEKGIAAFPEQLPYRLISLYSHRGETVLDPFLGSGTTMKVARMLRRNSIGFEFNEDLVPIIRTKAGF
jgi:modification methylase